MFRFQQVFHVMKSNIVFNRQFPSVKIDSFFIEFGNLWRVHVQVCGRSSHMLHRLLRRYIFTGWVVEVPKILGLPGAVVSPGSVSGGCVGKVKWLTFTTKFYGP
eukprot:gb/GEZJ01006348.1/.p1 GENE.gb/GEZJ01006348.1/~~gb/GEZJ01006348.1/.p1  ORF type:complete len:104 (-),score=1.90 gb/GEZJ01006348.1/:246-557(-)